MKNLATFFLAFFLLNFCGCEQKTNQLSKEQSSKVENTPPLPSPAEVVSQLCARLPILNLPVTDSLLWNYGYHLDSMIAQLNRNKIDSTSVQVLNLGKDVNSNCAIGCEFWGVGYVKLSENAVAILYGFTAPDMLEYRILTYNRAANEIKDRLLFFDGNNPGPLEVKQKSTWSATGEIEVLKEGFNPFSKKLEIQYRYIGKIDSAGTIIQTPTPPIHGSLFK